MLCSFKFHLCLILVSMVICSWFCFISFFYSHVGLLSHVLQMEFNYYELNTIYYNYYTKQALLLYSVYL